ncbi:hypothetical protein JL722_14137 [Aureococcus anophagefferens]|nr:hypothetical protein JL722_14137 [Aureococcus anophagefferens]
MEQELPQTTLDDESQTILEPEDDEGDDAPDGACEDMTSQPLTFRFVPNRFRRHHIAVQQDPSSLSRCVASIQAATTNESVRGVYRTALNVNDPAAGATARPPRGRLLRQDAAVEARRVFPATPGARATRRRRRRRLPVATTP